MIPLIKHAVQVLASLEITVAASADDVGIEWPSGLRHCEWNCKIYSSSPTRHLARLRTPISL